VTRMLRSAVLTYQNEREEERERERERERGGGRVDQKGDDWCWVNNEGKKWVEPLKRKEKSSSFGCE
jgi:hypothetical protein